MKPAVLFVKRRVPFPLDRGTDAVTFAVLSALADEFDVVLLSSDEGPRSQAGAAALRDQGIEVTLAPSASLPAHHGTVKAKLSINIKRLFQGIPRQYQVNDQPGLRAAIERLTRGRRFQLAQFEYWSIARYRNAAHCPAVLLNHDVTYSTARSIAAFGKSFRKRLVWNLEARALKQYELVAQGAFDGSLFLSSEDLQEMQAALPNLPKSAVLPVAFPFEPAPFEPATLKASGQARVSPTVLFVGAMDAPFNVDAVAYFTEHIWPTVRQAVPEAEFVIAGSAPPAEVQRLEVQPRVRVLGYVPDLAEVLKSAAVAVSPCRIGTGIKVKVAEAMAAGLPVVGTARGLSGYSDVSSLIRANHPDDFAKHVVRFLTDLTERRHAAEACLRHYVEHLWLPAARPRIVSFYERWIETVHRSPANTNSWSRSRGFTEDV